MRKSTLFISAALTVFIIAILAGVVSAYQNNINGTAGDVPAQPTTVAEAIASDPTQVPVSAPAQVVITPQEAASIASSVLGHTDVYSVELTQLNAIDVYLVTFSSGDLVYVGLDGQIISVSKLPVTVVSQPVNNNPDIWVTNRASDDHSEHESEHEGGDD